MGPIRWVDTGRFGDAQDSAGDKISRCRHQSDIEQT